MKKSLFSALLIFPLLSTVPCSSHAAYVPPPENDTTLFAGNIQNATGETIGAIDASGNITDAATGNNIGRVNAKGQVFASNGDLLGSVPAGEKNAAFSLAENTQHSGAPPLNFATNSAGDFAGQVKDENNIVVGNIDPTGAITDTETGEFIGRVQSNGQVFASDGSGLGSVDLGDQLAAYKMAKTGPVKINNPSSEDF